MTFLILKEQLDKVYKYDYLNSEAEELLSRTVHSDNSTKIMSVDFYHVGFIYDNDERCVEQYLRYNNIKYYKIPA